MLIIAIWTTLSFYEIIFEGERIKQLEIARNLKKLGLNTEAICQATGLSPQEVESL